MNINVDVYEVNRDDLYWKKEAVCDMAFDAEYRYRKARTEKVRNKWLLILMDVFDVQRKFEKRLYDEFGG